MVNPARNNPNDDFFAQYGKTDKANEAQPAQPSSSQAHTVDAGKWLDESKRFSKLDTQKAKVNFVLSLINSGNSTPTIESLSQEINSRYEKKISQSTRKQNKSEHRNLLFCT